MYKSRAYNSAIYCNVLITVVSQKKNSHFRGERIFSQFWGNKKLQILLSLRVSQAEVETIFIHTCLAVRNPFLAVSRVWSTLGARGFLCAGFFGLRPNTCRPAQTKQSSPSHARKNLWYPWLVWRKGATKVFKFELLKNLTAILNTNSPMFTLQQTLLSSPTIHVIQPCGSSPSAMCVKSLRSEKSELSTSNLH